MSALFQGSNDILDFAGCPVAGVPVTFAGWTKFNSLAGDTFAVLGVDGSTDNFFECRLSTDAIQGRYRDTADLSTLNEAGGARTTGVWYHVALIADSATTRRLYVDGILIDSETASTDVQPAVNYIVFGETAAAGQDFNGYLGHWAIWDVALTEEQVEELAAGAPPDTVDSGNCLAYWPMEADFTDAVGAYDLNTVGTVTVDGDNPPIDAGDVTAPVISSLVIDDITSVSATVSFSTDTAEGTAYVVIVPDADAPSNAQIIAGNDSADDPALDSDNDLIVSSGVHEFAVLTGLSAGVAYEVYVIHVDVATNESNVLTAGFTTGVEVAIVNSDIDIDPTLVAAPAAGDSRAAYYSIQSRDIVNGQYLCTALSVGGQTGTLVDSIKAPAGIYREGMGLAIFEFLEAKIALMTDGVITPTWGDIDGEPANPKYSQITYQFVDQTTPHGSVTRYQIDVTQTTWAPGNVRGIADGMVHAAASFGAGGALAFDALTQTVQLSNDASQLLVSTLATTDGSNISLNLTGVANRPMLVLGFEVNPIDVVKPVLSSPLANDIGTSTVTPSVVTTEEYGDLYYVIVPDGDAPSSAQIIAGTDSADDPAISDDVITPPVIGTNTFDEVIGLTNGVSYEIAYAHEDAAGNISDPSYIGFTTGAADTPDITTAPTVSSQTTTAYTVDLGEVTEDGTAYLGAYIPGATPTAAQVKAGTGAHGTANKAHTANTPIGTQTLTPSDTPKFPYYHIKIVYESAAGFSSVVTLEEFLDAATGKQFILMDEGPYADWMDDADPEPAEGDVLIWDLVSIEDAYEFEVSSDGNYILHVDDDTSRQSAERELWRLADQSLSGEQVFYVNNQPPSFIPSGEVSIELFVDIAEANYDLELDWEDFEDDVLVIDQSPDDLEVLPTGVTIVASEFVFDESTIEVGSYSVLIRATDVTSDYTEAFYDITVTGTIEMPDVDDGDVTEEDAISAIETAGLPTPSVSYVYDGVTDEGFVYEQSPEAGEFVTEDTPTFITVAVDSVGGGGAHIFPPRPGDPRVIAFLAAMGVTPDKGIAYDFRLALATSLSISAADALDYSLDEMWVKWKQANGVTGTGEPFDFP